MKRRTFIFIVLLSMIGATLINPVSANSFMRAPAGGKLHLQKKPLQQKMHRPSRGSSTFGTHSKDHQGLKHDSDKQLDVWVARCNKAGGGMILRDDGNYDCVGPQGYPIPW